MKTRYEESFLFPQGREDFGRSLVFPQGNLRGLGGTTEQQNLTYGFIFPQGETDDYGRALMFPQGQLHGLGDATLDTLNAAKNAAMSRANEIAAEIARLQAQIQQAPSQVYSLSAGIAYLRSQNLYYPEMEPAVVAATVHALLPDVYVSGAGTGYGTVGTEQNPQLIAQINQLNAAYQSALADVQGFQANIDYRPQAIAREKEAAAQREALRLLQEEDAKQAAAAAAQQAAAAAAAAVTTQPAILNKTIVAVNNTAGTVTSTNPATGTVTTTSPTTGATTTANVVTGAVTVTTGSGQTVSGTGSVTAGNTSTTVNQATGTVTTTNTTTGATTVTNAATGQSQTGTAQPTSYILDFHDNQFWLTTSAGAPVRNGSFDFKTPADFLSNSGITLAQTTLTAAASVKFANNHGVTTVVNSAGGTTTTNPTTGTVTTTNPVTGTVTTTNTATGTTTTTTPATGTTTTTTTPATDTGKLALYALLGVLLLRGAVR